jgi:hypothetical protein
VASLKFSCPECGHSFSARGGATTTCPKCNTEFADDGLAGAQAGGGEKWSYRTSWQRYAVLTVLVVVMGVLGYMLIQKRMNPPETTRGEGGGDDDIKVTNYTIKPGQMPPGASLKPLPAPGSPAGPAGAARPDDAPPPKAKGRSAADLRKQLVGTWEGKAGDETATVEYKDDGTFSYTAAGAKAITGTWKLEDPTNRASGPSMTWTAEGLTVPATPLSVRNGKIEKHPMLHRPADAGTFERK